MQRKESLWSSWNTLKHKILVGLKKKPVKYGKMSRVLGR